MAYNRNLYTAPDSALDAGIIYDQNESLMQDEINSGVKNGTIVVGMADNLSSSQVQYSSESFISRASGGFASISDGNGFLVLIHGNSVHNGYVEQSVGMTVNATQRVAPPAITAVINEAAFLNTVGSGSGIMSFTYENGWNINPSSYGITVSNDPVSGDKIEVSYNFDQSSVNMTVQAVARTAPAAITAVIDTEMFVAQMTSVSGTFTFVHDGSAWNYNPATYGITVSNTPVSGDEIVVTYTKEVRGTIIQSNPQTFVSTGWNLYDHSKGYARVLKYSDTYGFGIDGAYTSLEFSSSLNGTRTSVVVTNGRFTIEEDGYIWVTGGNDIDTQIWMTWSDWQSDANGGSWNEYTESTIDFSSLMAEYFPNGLLNVKTYYDEIDFSNKKTVKRVERVAYSSENLETVKALETEYEYDENYIYYGLSSPVINVFELDNDYTVSDHGMEFFTGTAVEVYANTLYGNNLKNKLERDVLTMSQQTLTASQLSQIATNIGKALYPVGSIYMSVNSTSPASIFGGTWERIKDAFLLSAGDTYSAGTTGGSATHLHSTTAVALTVAQLPKVSGYVDFRKAKGSSATYNVVHNTGGQFTTSAGGGATVGIGMSAVGLGGETAGDRLTYSFGSGSTHTHGNTGSSSSLPPYLSVYVWKRTT